MNIELQLLSILCSSVCCGILACALAPIVRKLSIISGQGQNPVEFQGQVKGQGQWKRLFTLSNQKDEKDILVSISLV